MRQLTPVTNLLLAVVLSAALVLTLGLPWYAQRKPPKIDDPEGIEGTAAAVARWFGDAGPKLTGAEALPTVKVLLMGLAAATAVLALLVLAGPLRSLLESVLKAVPMVAPLVVLVQILDAPAGMELRWGVFAALAASLLLANSAFHGAGMRVAKPRPAPYAPPSRAGSASPPGA